MAALAPLFLLGACLLTPGKFASTLDIRADRTFTFTYTGEVIATEPGGGMGRTDEEAPAPDNGEEDAPEDAYFMPIAQQKSPDTRQGRNKAGDADEAPDLPDPATERKMHAIAQALAKEAGFRSARYLGDNRFAIDYAMTSRLGHSFVFPFNVDAQAVFPFVMVEVRADGKVRVQAPGFAAGSNKAAGMPGTPGADDAGKALDGTFTLVTDAEIVSQNQEDGAVTTARGRQVTWTITPSTRTAPMATLRFPAGR